MNDQLPTQPAAQPRQPKQSLIATMAQRYAMDPQTFLETMKKTVMPSNASNEQLAAFLLVANQYDLNPVTKEIYAFPDQRGGVTPVVGVDGWINLAQRRPEFDGMEFEYEHDANGKLSSCTCRLYRSDRSRPVVVTEFMDECARSTQPWKSHPRRMLRHKAVIQAIRYAFGFSGIKDEDDAEVISVSGNTYAAQGGTTEDAAPYQSGAERAKAALEHSTQAQAQAQPATEPEASSEWPKPDPDTGELVDSHGCPWLEQVHSSGKTCTQDGYWRRRKGILPNEANDAEQAAIAARKEQAEPTPEQESQAEAQTETQAAQSSDVQMLHYYQQSIEGAYEHGNAEALNSLIVAVGDDMRLLQDDRDKLMSQAADMLASLNL